MFLYLLWRRFTSFICCVLFMLASLATIGFHWVESFPSMKLKNDFVHWKMSPEPLHRHWGEQQMGKTSIWGEEMLWIASFPAA